MSDQTEDRPDEVPIATQTRISQDPPKDESDDEVTIEESDEAPIANKTRVVPRT